MQEALEAALARKFNTPVRGTPTDQAEKLGNDWYELRVQNISGEMAIKSLRERWDNLRIGNDRIINYLAIGMYVDKSEVEKFVGVREIQRKIRSFLPPHFRPNSIVHGYKSFSTGAEVFTAGIIDLSDPSRPNSEDVFEEFGYQICRQATSGSKLRLEHVLPAAEIWLNSLK